MIADEDAGGEEPAAGGQAQIEALVPQITAM